MAMTNATGQLYRSSGFTTTVVTKNYTLAEVVDKVCSGELDLTEVFPQLPASIREAIDGLAKAKFQGDRLAVFRQLQSGQAGLGIGSTVKGKVLDLFRRIMAMCIFFGFGYESYLALPRLQVWFCDLVAPIGCGPWCNSQVATPAVAAAVLGTAVLAGLMAFRRVALGRALLAITTAIVLVVAGRLMLQWVFDFFWRFVVPDGETGIYTIALLFSVVVGLAIAASIRWFEPEQFRTCLLPFLVVWVGCRFEAFYIEQTDNAWFFSKSLLMPLAVGLSLAVLGFAISSRNPQRPA